MNPGEYGGDNLYIRVKLDKNDGAKERRCGEVLDRKNGVRVDVVMDVKNINKFDGGFVFASLSLLAVALLAVHGGYFAYTIANSMSGLLGLLALYALPLVALGTIAVHLEHPRVAAAVAVVPQLGAVSAFVLDIGINAIPLTGLFATVVAGFVFTVAHLLGTLSRWALTDADPTMADAKRLYLQFLAGISASGLLLFVGSLFVGNLY